LSPAGRQRARVLQALLVRDGLQRPAALAVRAHPGSAARRAPAAARRPAGRAAAAPPPAAWRVALLARPAAARAAPTCRSPSSLSPSRNPSAAAGTGSARDAHAGTQACLRQAAACKRSASHASLTLPASVYARGGTCNLGLLAFAVHLASAHARHLALHGRAPGLAPGDVHSSGAYLVAEAWPSVKSAQACHEGCRLGRLTCFRKVGASPRSTSSTPRWPSAPCWRVESALLPDASLGHHARDSRRTFLSLTSNRAATRAQ
jgi:hypothetical protein